MCPINSDGTFGEPIKWEGLKSIEEFSEEGQVSFNALKETQFTGTFYISHTKKSRKTFKKWLMQFPWADRDLAECWCFVISLAHGRVSYARTYRDMFFDQTFFGMVNSIGNQLKETEKHG
jgi:hypothetical protein